MNKRKKLENKNPFTNLLDSLKEGKLGHNQIQIAYRAWIRESDCVPEACKDVLGGSTNQSGLLYGMFKTINMVVGGMELVHRRAYEVGYTDGVKVGQRKTKKKVVHKKTKRKRKRLRRGRH